jgi:hypothetical protein
MHTTKKALVVEAIRKLGADASLSQLRREVEARTGSPVSSSYLSLIRADVLGNTVAQHAITQMPEMSRKKAIETVVSQLGDRTSLRTLVNAATKLCGKKVDMCYASLIRSAWRRKHRSLTDNRTYEGQPDRDMVVAPSLSSALDLDSLRALRSFAGSTPKKWTNWLPSSTSLDRSTPYAMP